MSDQRRPEYCSQSILARAGFIALFILAFTLPAFADDQFVDLIRMPDSVSVVLQSNTLDLHPDGSDGWRQDGVTVRTKKHRGGLELELASPAASVKHLILRWRAAMPPDWKYLGDAWERSYGDLEWKPLDDRRVMPWYFLAKQGSVNGIVINFDSQVEC